MNIWGILEKDLVFDEEKLIYASTSKEKIEKKFKEILNKLENLGVEFFEKEEDSFYTQNGELYQIIKAEKVL